MHTPPSVSYSHAVSRSSELLSCAKTALKVAKAQHANDPPSHVLQWYQQLDPTQLRLAGESRSDSPVVVLCQDALSLLRAMQQALTKLQALVRRRGHTNDPTHDIALAAQQLEQDAKELNEIVTALQRTRTQTAQHHRHLELVAMWLQTMASQQTAELKQILHLRGNVLADQAQRRKLLNPQKNSGTSRHTIINSSQTPRLPSSRPHVAAMNSPLFTMTPANKVSTPTNGSARPQNSYVAAAKTNGTSSDASYGASGHGYGGYGGGASYGGTTGMRQRRTTAQQDNQNDVVQVQSQIQERQAQRDTQNRLDQAKQAESTLAELGTLFGKMTHLISAQGEQLEKLEDDVEAAMGDVTAGQVEIQTLYSIKKGNRALIIKVFAILIFFILFMRLY